MIITDKPIVEYVPLHRPTSQSDDNPVNTVTQYEMSVVDHLGLLKVDFLGLTTLTIMSRACDLIKPGTASAWTLAPSQRTSRKCTISSVRGIPPACSNWKARG